MQISAGKGKYHGSIQIQTACAEITVDLAEMNNPGVASAKVNGSRFSFSVSSSLFV